MAKYKTEHGFQIKAYSSDPPSPAEGEIWYNTTTQKLKVAPLLPGTWASGGNTTKGRRMGGATGTQTAGLFFGGYEPGDPNSGIIDNSEEYDGSSWTEGDNLNTARYGAGGAGSQTAGLAMGGHPPYFNNSEEYNGTSWTEGDNLNTGRAVHGNSFGTQTAAICAGGNIPPGATNTDLVESYNGTSWSEVGDLNTARFWSGASNQSPGTDGIIFGGSPEPSAVNSAESYDGSSWTEEPNLNSARFSLKGGGTSSTSAVGFGGSPFTGNTEEFDGTSWVEQNNLSAGRNYLSGCGTTTSALAFGGEPGPGASPTTSTEEWTKAVSARTVDTT